MHPSVHCLVSHGHAPLRTALLNYQKVAGGQSRSLRSDSYTEQTPLGHQLLPTPYNTDRPPTPYTKPVPPNPTCTDNYGHSVHRCVSPGSWPLRTLFASSGRRESWLADVHTTLDTTDQRQCTMEYTVVGHSVGHQIVSLLNSSA